MNLVALVDVCTLSVHEELSGLLTISSLTLSFSAHLCLRFTLLDGRLVCCYSNPHRYVLPWAVLGCEHHKQQQPLDTNLCLLKELKAVRCLFVYLDKVWLHFSGLAKQEYRAGERGVCGGF